MRENGNRRYIFVYRIIPSRTLFVFFLMSSINIPPSPLPFAFCSFDDRQNRDFYQSNEQHAYSTCKKYMYELVTNRATSFYSTGDCGYLLNEGEKKNYPRKWWRIFQLFRSKSVANKISDLQTIENTLLECDFVRQENEMCRFNTYVYL